MRPTRNRELEMKQSLNIKAIVLALLAVTFFSVTSCTKTDDRDQFEGSYLVDGTGSLTLHGVSQNATIPFNANNELMTLTKTVSSSNEMVASGFLGGTATVIGNTIQFESFSKTSTNSETGMTIQALFDIKKGTLNGNVLTFRIEITGTAYYQGSSLPVDGAISCIATKRE